ncbi:MAG: FAD-dependent oxidoreductase [Armatimonadota bacterium]
MPDKSYKYIIVGGGLAGASAVEGIRERDKGGSILLFGSEKHLPYDRPPLTKKLWFGQKKVEEIFVHDSDFYKANNVDLAFDVDVVGVDASGKNVTDSRGDTYPFDKLLLATGGVPRTLDIPGGDLDGIYYYRYLDDYLRLRGEAIEEARAVVIGGGFIGSEIAAALNINEVEVTMIYPEAYIVQRVFPEGLGRAIQDEYIDRGVNIYSSDVPVTIEKQRSVFLTRTKAGALIESDMVIIGAGIIPSIELAEMAGLTIQNGITVNDRLQTSNTDIYAAGDNAYFPYAALGEMMGVEHWDNAINQGKQAGLNMAGADEPYTYMPYFFSDLFDFGYEAVGDINSKLETHADWQKEYDTGTIYYLKDGKVRGMMMCNVWERVEDARSIIRNGRQILPEDLRGAIT